LLFFSSRAQDGTEDCPLEMEVKVNEDGKDVWKMLPVQVARSGDNEGSWTLSFEWPPGNRHTGTVVVSFLQG